MAAKGNLVHWYMMIMLNLLGFINEAFWGWFGSPLLCKWMIRRKRNRLILGILKYLLSFSNSGFTVHACACTLNQSYCEESWALKNFWTVVLEKTLESPLDCKEIQPVHPKRDQSWVVFGRTDTEAETPILWPPHAKSWLVGKDPWCWEGLGAGGEGDDRGWDGWMASPTRWTWVWVNSRSLWWTGRPGVLRFMGSQRVEHNWVTELNWTDSAY